MKILLKELQYKLNLDSDFYSLLVYMENELDLNSEIHFFDESITSDNIEFYLNGTKYINLFSLILGVEFYSYFSDYFRQNKYNDKQKAQRLLEYIINDA